MEYRELKIQTEKKHLERLEAELIENGFTSMMIDDPDDIRDILEHPDVYRYDYISDELTGNTGRMPVITLFFAEDEAGRSELARAEAVLKEFSESTGGEIRPQLLQENAGDDSEWLYKWQEHFRPTRVGERIVVKPGWEEYQPEEGDLVIEMDPGMAFGSGLHETTSMCIRALEKILSERRDGDLPGESEASASYGEKSGLSVLDVGTGTGILAIASVLLGADEALGIDIDPDAVRVANENIEKNWMTGKIKAQYGDLTEGVGCKADILVANLMADLVMRLSPAAALHLDKGGWYITSGILDIKEDIVCNAIRSAGFVIEEVLHDGEWCAVIARRN